MSNKAARRRHREQQRLRALESLPKEDRHVACADAEVAAIDDLLDEAGEILRELAWAATNARERWPATADTDELRAMLDAIRGVAAECRTKLAATGDRITRFHDAHPHLHIAGGRVVRMVPVQDDASGPDDDIPF